EPIAGGRRLVRVEREAAAHGLLRVRVFGERGGRGKGDREHGEVAERGSASELGHGRLLVAPGGVEGGRTMPWSDAGPGAAPRRRVKATAPTPPPDIPLIAWCVLGSQETSSPYGTSWVFSPSRSLPVPVPVPVPDGSRPPSANRWHRKVRTI